MTAPIVNPLDVAFVLSVAGAGWVWAPLALFVGAAYFGLSAFLADRRIEAKP